MKGFLGKLFGQEPTHTPLPVPPPAQPVAPPNVSAAYTYKRGDLVGGRYRIHGTLGKGGFGVVYVAYHQQLKVACALKTFRDELLADARARAAFKKEAVVWVNLDAHPFILAARFVDEHAGRLFVEMDLIAPDAFGRVNLADHLADGPFENGQALIWATQFCLGMEHALAHGISSHRDIKPG